MSVVSNILMSTTINPSALKIPFMFLHDQFGFSINSILREIPTMPMIDLGTYPNTFPNTISKYFWIQQGIPGSKPWIALGKLKNGLYFYYTAVCMNTEDLFLYNRGHMNLWISSRFDDLIQNGMDSFVYKTYTDECKIPYLENE